MNYKCVSCEKDVEIEDKHMCRKCLLENSQGRSLGVNKMNRKADDMKEILRHFDKTLGWKVEPYNGDNS